jgi:glycosyltransferase involved in cell wall biosynthesis
VRVVFCWSDISGYIASCWRALAATGVDLFVFAYEIGAGEPNIAFSNSVMHGLDHRLLTEAQAHDPKTIADLVIDQKPDIVVLPGWFNPAYVALTTHPKLSHVKFVMTMDTPWRNQLRQKVARLKIGAYLDRMSAVVVAGERAWQYARYLQIPEQKLLRGVYGFEASPLESVLARRQTNPWPQRFLYAGRYVEDKAIDILIAGYEQYRALSKEPWPLDCCGRGPMRQKILDAQGVTDIGFVQPADLPRVLLEHGAFIIVSRYEPWGVAIAEAQYSGLPVICSEACGASVEIVRHHASGLLVPTEDATSLARAMLWMEQNSAELPAMGEIGKSLAKPFAAEFWARRWKAKIEAISQ